VEGWAGGTVRPEAFDIRKDVDSSMLPMEVRREWNECHRRIGSGTGVPLAETTGRGGSGGGLDAAGAASFWFREERVYFCMASGLVDGSQGARFRNSPQRSHSSDRFRRRIKTKNTTVNHPARNRSKLGGTNFPKPSHYTHDLTRNPQKNKRATKYKTKHDQNSNPQ